MNRKIIIPVILALAAIIVAPYALHPAEAHILKNFSPTLSIKIGWLNEPPFVGDLNEVDVYVYNGTNDNAPPIVGNALNNMTVTAQYGGHTKTLDFEASDDTPGLYVSALTPSQAGTYNMIIQGNINGTVVPSTTYPMQDVEAKDSYYFPPMSTSMNAMNMSGNMNSTSMSNNAVPEFGSIASLVLVIAIVSVIAVTAKTRGFLNF
jgi:predicted secreted protein with PEFG-CTERM motif